MKIAGTAIMLAVVSVSALAQVVPNPVVAIA
jgi:hypothetical protein